ncbi:MULTISPECIES: polysaccharide pyruvyl transferase family protein [unclassified Corynebacterium]|uniref:polysaccharide pyruvyl transferase family protein n=1 Tax=unclassified Corynebacterium TaxID=2624378 RepID=UPI002648F65A|nr:polysaccharide pyruvyl transferase family protein [Corynebacterium sp.]MDN5583036.1 polysaccharide pyruvyl transferase family protein [Corynebacterium sp.]MDN5719935.1 polysaccharide pyruvyl transferase family protein [Corynebacterium sp.]MDN6511009.1 polysaccharide pyruvyl transferase family protein [Corynebacterium sp.]
MTSLVSSPVNTVRTVLSEHTPAEIARAVAHRASSVDRLMALERRASLTLAGRGTTGRGTTGRGSAGRRAAATRPVDLLVTTVGNGNIGDQAMFEAALGKLGKLGATSGGRIIAVVPSADAFTVPPVYADRVTLVELPALTDGNLLTAGLARRRLTSYFPTARSLTVIGADVMDGGYQGREAALRLLALELGARAGLDCRVLGFSWSAHPDPYVLQRFRDLDQDVQLFARDAVSRERMGGAGIGGVGLAADIVFTHRIDAASTPFGDWAGRQQDDARRVAVVNVSGLVLKRLSRSGGAQTYLDEMAETVRRLVARDWSVVLVPHVVRAGDDDLDACRQVHDRLQDAATAPYVTLADRLLSPAEVLGIVTHADVVVSARMHLGILTLSSGRPCVLFDTQGKVEGLMREFGLSDCVLAPAETTADRLVAMVDTARAVARDTDALSTGLATMTAKAELNFA